MNTTIDLSTYIGQINCFLFGKSKHRKRRRAIPKELHKGVKNTVKE